MILGLMVPALAMVILGYTRPEQTTQAVVLLVIAVGSNAAALSGYAVNHMDLSPNHAGTLQGLCNGFSQSTGAIAPLVVQMFVKDEVRHDVVKNSTHFNRKKFQTDPLQWRTVFLITAGFNIATASFFNFFGSGEVQPWNDSSQPTTLS